MSLSSIITTTQIILSIFLGTLILLQQRGGGLSSVFGQSGFYHTRRGLEKHVARATVGAAILFLCAAALNVFLR